MTTVAKKKYRVLAIDDEPSVTEWLKILLEHEGYEVRSALIGTREPDSGMRVRFIMPVHTRA